MANLPKSGLVSSYHKPIHWSGAIYSEPLVFLYIYIYTHYMYRLHTYTSCLHTGATGDFVVAITGNYVSNPFCRVQEMGSTSNNTIVSST